VVPSNEKNVNLVRGSRVRNLIAPGVSRLRKSNKSKRGAAKLNGLDNTSLQGIRLTDVPREATRGAQERPHRFSGCCAFRLGGRRDLEQSFPAEVCGKHKQVLVLHHTFQNVRPGLRIRIHRRSGRRHRERVRRHPIFARQKPVAARLMDDQTFKYSSVPVGAEPYST
jgi:hypothetical protein